MLALRLLVLACGALIVLGLLGYSISRDPRYLRLASYAFKSGLAIAAILGLVYLLARFL